MKWTVEVTHEGTGEEMELSVDAGSREQAIARARDAGLAVRDCYPAGRGVYKGVRVLAWVWFGACAFFTVSILLCGFGGCLATPGDSGVKEATTAGTVAAALAIVGLLTARATSKALRRDPPPDPRRGFEVGPAAGPTVVQPPPSQGP